MLVVDRIPVGQRLRFLDRCFVAQLGRLRFEESPEALELCGREIRGLGAGLLPNVCEHILPTLRVRIVVCPARKQHRALHETLEAPGLEYRRLEGLLRQRLP